MSSQLINALNISYENKERRYKDLSLLLIKHYNQYVTDNLDQSNDSLIFTRYLIILNKALSSRDNCYHLLQGFLLFFNTPDKNIYIEMFMEKNGPNQLLGFIEYDKAKFTFDEIHLAIKMIFCIYKESSTYQARFQELGLHDKLLGLLCLVEDKNIHHTVCLFFIETRNDFMITKTFRLVQCPLIMTKKSGFYILSALIGFIGVINNKLLHVDNAVWLQDILPQICRALLRPSEFNHICAEIIIQIFKAYGNFASKNAREKIFSENTTNFDVKDIFKSPHKICNTLTEYLSAYLIISVFPDANALLPAFAYSYPSRTNENKNTESTTSTSTTSTTMTTKYGGSNRDKISKTDESNEDEPEISNSIKKSVQDPLYLVIYILERLISLLETWNGEPSRSHEKEEGEEEQEEEGVSCWENNISNDSDNTQPAVRFVCDCFTRNHLVEHILYRTIHNISMFKTKTEHPVDSFTDLMAKFKWKQHIETSAVNTIHKKDGSISILLNPPNHPGKNIAFISAIEINSILDEMRVGSIIEQTDRLSTLLQKLIDLDYNSLALIKTITDSHGISLHVNEITHVDMNSMIQAMFNPESHFEPYLKLMNTLETTKINPLMRFEKLQKVLDFSVRADFSLIESKELCLKQKKKRAFAKLWSINKISKTRAKKNKSFVKYRKIMDIIIRVSESGVQTDHDKMILDMAAHQVAEAAHDAAIKNQKRIDDPERKFPLLKMRSQHVKEATAKEDPYRVTGFTMKDGRRLMEQDRVALKRRPAVYLSATSYSMDPDKDPEFSGSFLQDTTQTTRTSSPSQNRRANGGSSSSTIRHYSNHDFQELTLSDQIELDEEFLSGLKLIKEENTTTHYRKIVPVPPQISKPTRTNKPKTFRKTLFK